MAGWNIFVHVVLNAEGLGKKMYAVGMVPSGAPDIAAFGASFSITQPLFSFVDVGHGKEMADHKVRELLRAMVRVPQCKHVIFGPAHDTGYIPFLQQYNNDSEVMPKLTLLETQPAHHAFGNLGFRRTKFPSVFRTEQLPGMPSRQHQMASSTSMGPPLTPPISTTSGVSAGSRVASIASAAALATLPFSQSLRDPLLTPNRTPSVTSAEPVSTPKSATEPLDVSAWTTIKPRVSVANPKNVIDITPKKPAPTKRHIIVNKDDERLDPAPLLRDPDAEYRLHERIAEHGKLCNKYHLVDRCDFDCEFYHGAKLPIAELSALRNKARTLRCHRLGDCRDVYCTLGHVCRVAQVGQRCSLPKCLFSSTHSDFDMVRTFIECC